MASIQIDNLQNVIALTRNQFTGRLEGYRSVHGRVSFERQYGKIIAFHKFDIMGNERNVVRFEKNEHKFVNHLI